MDKEGFDIIDQQFKKELTAKEIDVKQKWEEFYMRKDYTGNLEMNAKARSFDEEQKKEKISIELKSFSEKLGFLHFGEGGRERALQKALETNASQSKEDSNEQFVDRKEALKMLQEARQKLSAQKDINHNKKKGRKL